MPDALVRIVYQDAGAESGINRVSAALGRLERSEPTRALRATRLAVDELANAATGLHPALGRLVSTLAEFGIGGATGLAAVAGFAAIGFEIKTIAGFAGELDERLKKLNTTVAGLGRGQASALNRLGAMADVEPTQPGIWTRLFARLGTAGVKGTGDLSEAISTGMDTEESSNRQGQMLLAGQIRSTRNARLDEQTKKANAASTAVLEHAISLEKLRLGSHATELQLLDFTTQMALLKNALSDLDPKNKARINTLIGEAAELERTRILERERAASLSRVLTAGGGGQRGNLGGESISNAVLKQTAEAAVGVSLMVTGAAGVQGAGRPAPTKPDIRNLELAVGAAMSVVSGLAQGGGAGSAIGGLGSAATALSGLKGISAGASGILGPLGIGLSAVSSLFGLFGGGGQAHVIIDGYDSHAMSQQQQLMLALTGFKGLNIELLNASPGLAYRLGREARTDGNMRVPPGAGF